MLVPRVAESLVAMSPLIGQSMLSVSQVSLFVMDLGPTGSPQLGEYFSDVQLHGSFIGPWPI